MNAAHTDRRATLDPHTETRMALRVWRDAAAGTDADSIYRALAEARAALTSARRTA